MNSSRQQRRMTVRNKVILTGRLTADVELKQTQSGECVCDFDIAVARNNRNDATDFIKIEAWRATAVFAEKYLYKGALIEVEGSLRSRRWVDSEGKTRNETYVRASEIVFAPINTPKKALQKDDNEATE